MFQKTDRGSEPVPAANVRAVARQIISGAIEERVQSSRRKELVQLLLPELSIRLAGRSENGEERDLSDDIGNVIELERPLVIDPAAVKKELAALPTALHQVDGDSFKLPPADFPFMLKGGHVFLSTREQLQLVHDRGFIWLAEIAGIPIGYSHGLSEVPYGGGDVLDQDFPNLDAGDVLPPDFRAFLTENRQKMAVVWRTGIRESLPPGMLQKIEIDLPEQEKSLGLRRLGIATALKYVIANQMRAREKIGLTLNIGSISTGNFTDMDVMMTNLASTSNNRNFLLEAGSRNTYHTPIDLPIGEGVEHVANMYWRVFTGNLTRVSMFNRMEEVLMRIGWTEEDLEVLRTIGERGAEHVQ